MCYIWIDCVWLIYNHKCWKINYMHHTVVYVFNAQLYTSHKHTHLLIDNNSISVWKHNHNPSNKRFHMHILLVCLGFFLIPLWNSSDLYWRSMQYTTTYVHNCEIMVNEVNVMKQLRSHYVPPVLKQWHKVMLIDVCMQ